MPKQSLILIGGGGHCKSVLEVIRTSGKWHVAGILDRQELIGTNVLDQKIIGTDDELDAYIAAGHHFLITIGQIKSAAPRQRIFASLLAKGAPIATVIADEKAVSAYATIGAGTVIHHRVSVNADVVIGQNCIINTGANVEHDCRIGNHTHISTGVLLNGNVVIGDTCLLGTGSIVSHGVQIGENTIVGAGSLVIRDITVPGTYAGVPCKKI